MFFVTFKQTLPGELRSSSCYWLMLSIACIFIHFSLKQFIGNLYNVWPNSLQFVLHQTEEFLIYEYIQKRRIQIICITRLDAIFEGESVFLLFILKNDITLYLEQEVHSVIRKIHPPSAITLILKIFYYASHKVMG